jgi:hypothetical protein
MGKCVCSPVAWGRGRGRGGRGTGLGSIRGEPKYWEERIGGREDERKKRRFRRVDVQEINRGKEKEGVNRIGFGETLKLVEIGGRGDTWEQRVLNDL